MSTTSGSFRGAVGLRNRIGLVLLVLLAGAGNVACANRSSDQNRGALKAIQIQVGSQQLAVYALQLLSGNLYAFDDIKSIRDEIEANINQLDTGDSNHPGYGKSGAVGEEIRKLKMTWKPIRDDADLILAQKEPMLDLTQTVKDFSSRIPQITFRMEEVIQTLLRKNAPGEQVYMVTRQLLLADRMLRRASDVLKGGDQATEAAAQFGRDTLTFQRVLAGLIDGNAEMGINQVTDPEAKKYLAEVSDMFSNLDADIKKIQSFWAEVGDINRAAQNMVTESRELLERSIRVSRALD